MWARQANKRLVLVAAQKFTCNMLHVAVRVPMCVCAYLITAHQTLITSQMQIRMGGPENENEFLAK